MIEKKADQSLNIFDLIDQLCADFRRQWKAEKRPRIEDFLKLVPDDAREQLFRNLLTLEIRYRERAGDKINPGEYSDRFPELRKAVGDAFHYSTSVSVDVGKGTALESANTRTYSIDSPAANRIGEYELVRELGRGGFGVVYEAKHVTRHNRVALKTLPTGQSDQEINAERLHRFRREFRSLSEINHPNLVGMQTLEVAGSQWFFTMDLIVGDDFLSYVRPKGELDESRLRASLNQLVTGVNALHEKRILHRDLKPSNVLVSDDGHVSILDFGLVAELETRTDHTASIRTQHFAGTPRYAAPEQLFGERSPATDWYALGTMLFEALTGESPYQGTAAELMVKKREEDVPSICGRDDLPNDLTELADALIRRAPDERPDWDAIAEVLGLDSTTQTSYVSHDEEQESYASMSDPSAQILVGREEQLEQLADAKTRFLTDRRPEIVWLTGLSGEGKSSLAEKFLAPIRRARELVVLSGRCYDRESVPFKAVDVLIEALVSFLRSRSVEEVNAWLPKDIQMLARLFPTLRRVESIEKQPVIKFSTLDERQLRYRAFFALRDLLLNIGRLTPILVFIDDLQWGDSDSAEVLHELLAPPEPPALFLLGSYRTDEAIQSPFLQEWGRRNQDDASRLSEQTVKVTSLTEEQCLQFVAQRIGVEPNELRELSPAALSDTKGNPYFLEQLIEGFNPETGEFDAVPLSDIVDRKLRQLPIDSRELLVAIAVAGQAVTVKEASLVAGHDSPMFATVTHMRSEKLVRLIGSDKRQLVDTYHDKIRETLLDRLGDEKRRDWHLRFGEYLERQEELSNDRVLSAFESSDTDELTSIDSSRIHDLAYHFYAAGDPRSFAYQLLGGHQAFLAFASEDAVEHLQRALSELPSVVSERVRYRLLLELGICYERLTQLKKAREFYEQAIECAPSSLEASHAYFGIACCYRYEADYDPSLENYDLALRAIGTRLPSSMKAAISIPWLAVKALMIPERWQRARNESKIKRAEIEHNLYRELALHAFEHVSIFRYVHSYLIQVVVAFQSGNPMLISQGLTVLSPHLAQSVMPKTGLRVLRRSDRYMGTERDDKVEGVYQYSYAVTMAHGIDPSEALRRYETALPLLYKCGAHTDASLCSHLYRHLMAVMASSGVELEAARNVARLAEEVGDNRGRLWGNYDQASALARRGDLKDALERISDASKVYGVERNQLSGIILLATEAWVRLQASDYRGALELGVKCWERSLRRMYFMEYNARGLAYLCESLAGKDWTSSSDSLDKKMLRKYSRRLAIFSKVMPGLTPHALRARGRAFAAFGSNRKAIRCIEQSLKKARQHSFEFDRAKSLLDLAAVKEEHREKNRAEAIELLKRLESVIPRAESWLLGDQYDESVVAPEFDLEAWEKENERIHSKS